MEFLRGRVGVFKSFWLKWRSLKYIPLRKKYFIGYDLKGNTYWEFYLENKNDRRRRIVEYAVPRHHSEQDIPPQCIMWLRRTRPDFPTLDELASDLRRQQQMKILAQQADERWKKGSLLQNPGLTPEQQKQLKRVTNGHVESQLDTRLHQETFEHQETSKQNNSSKEQQQNLSDIQEENNPFIKQQENPIEQAAIKPRR